MKAAIAILSSTVISVWVIGLIPLDELHIHGPWLAICYRSLQTTFSIAMMRFFCPKSLWRLSFKVKRAALPGLILLAVFLSASNVFQIPWSNTSFYTIWMGALFTLFIGIDEEVYSRGLIFGVLEKYGPWIAILGSSLDFGLLHITNYFYGGQNLDVTVSQMIGAASFGFMSAGLMLYSRSIWPSIILHGLSDFQMTQETAEVYAKSLTASPDWLGTGVETLMNVSIGLLLIVASGTLQKLKLNQTFVRHTKPIAEYLGLVTSDQT